LIAASRTAPTVLCEACALASPFAPKCQRDEIIEVADDETLEAGAANC
jgi:hypothetical protein